MDEVPGEPAEIQELLRQARAGDRPAMERLFAAYRAYLLRFVELRLDARLRARVDPSDVIQDAQLEAFRRLNDYLERRPMPFRLWLRQITNDRILKMHRRHVATARRDLGREVPLPEWSTSLLAQQLLAKGSTPSQQLSHRELARRLRQAVAQLTEPDREVVLLRHFEGLSNQEVGYLLGLDPGTVSKRHGRALLRLHKVLFEGGLTESQL
jgi:RNA polymerase sigma-70 factor (ECF subfamily)